MKERLCLDRPLLVEGKYDKIRLQSLVSSEILVTDGFGIFKEKEKTSLLRRLAEIKGLLVLTDSDGGGLVIRSYLRSVLPKERVIHLYIPEIKGKEPRKQQASKEGLLGVEGMEEERLYALLAPYAVNKEISKEPTAPMGKAELYEMGLVGKSNSAEKRRKLCLALDLPTNLSSNAFLEAIGLLGLKDEVIRLVNESKKEGENKHEG